MKYWHYLIREKGKSKKGPSNTIAALLIYLFCLILINPTAADTLVPAGSVWKYLDNGSNQGTAWKEMIFDETGWKSGAAQLGYGDGDETTVVSYGGNASSKYITTYFRKSFTIADASLYQALTLDLLYDDGAVVYLNGTEAARVNLPDGTISYNTLASVGAEFTWYTKALNTSLLVAGTNVLAVEMHQAVANSSDLSFDLELTAASINEISIVGVADQQDYQDIVSFTVNSAAGYDYTATLNGSAIATDVTIVLDQPDFYELYVHRRQQSSGIEESVLIHFTVMDSARGVSERGLPTWTPYPMIPSAAAEFAGGQLQIVTPAAYPMGLEIPVIARVEDSLGKRRGVNGEVTAAGFEAHPLRLFRGVGSVFLPAAVTADPISYMAEIQTLQTSKQIAIEASTAWQNITADLAASANWGENARIRITSSVGSAFTIPVGVTLTIGAGSVIVIDPGLEIEVLGSFVVNGTLEQPVVFTAQNRSAPWGGFLLETSTSQANITGAILTAACADSKWFATYHTGDHKHRNEQCLFYLGSGSHLTLTKCFMVENYGQIGHGERAVMSMTGCLVQKCITAGQYNYGTDTLADTALIECPSADAPYVDGDNDAIYFTGSSNTHTVTDCLIGWTMDDGIDSMGKHLYVTDCWFESIYHDAMAMSSVTNATVTGSVYINNGQALEAGWNDPVINATNTFCTGNVVGARFGDCYDETNGYHYLGYLNVSGSLLLYNTRDIWNWSFTDWAPNFAHTDIQDNYVSVAYADYPDNALWQPLSDPNQANLLLPFLPSPAGTVGIGIAMREDVYHLTGLTNRIPVRLSTFTPNPVAVDYDVYTNGGLYDSGSLQFLPGETLTFIEFALPSAEGLREVLVTLSNPVSAEITRFQQVLFMIPYEIEVPLIQTGEVWRYFKGTSEPPANWNDLGFIDTAWLTGATGIGYEKETGYGPCLATTLSDMQNSYYSIYARKGFSIEDPSRVTGLTFTMEFDDGYIAYLNGTAVYSENPPAVVAYNQPAGGSHEAACGGTPTPIDLSDNIDLLVPGDNVLAVQVHNVTLNSTDYILIPQLFATLAPWPGDFEPDGDVDIDDFVELAAAWLSQPGDGSYNHLCDINNPPDQIINMLDLEVLVEHWLLGF